MQRVLIIASLKAGEIRGWDTKDWGNSVPVDLVNTGAGIWMMP
jgi:hypothetical protein